MTWGGSERVMYICGLINVLTSYKESIDVYAPSSSLTVIPQRGAVKEDVIPQTSTVPNAERMVA
jgi:hypothetical protein